MLQSQRQREILTRLKLNPFLSTKQLAKELNVSEMTIRRDFNELAGKGIIVREHGGALLPDEAEKQTSDSDDEKGNLAISKAAANLVSPGDCIFLDSSHTALALLRFLQQQVTIVTNSNLSGGTISGFKGEIILLGGSYDSKGAATYGSLCLANLQSFHFDCCFLSCAAVSLDNHKVYSRDTNGSLIKTTALKLANRKVLLADTGKFTEKGFYSFADLAEFDYLLSDYSELDTKKIPHNTQAIRVNK